MKLTDIFDHEPQAYKPSKSELAHLEWLKQIEQGKQRRVEEARKAAEEHRRADDERKRLTAERDEMIAKRKAAGNPLRHTQIRILDCQLELTLAENAFKRNPGQKILMNDGGYGISKAESRVRAAERELKAAKDADQRTSYMMSAPGQTTAANFPPGPDVSGFLDHKHYIKSTWEKLKGKK